MPAASIMKCLIASSILSRKRPISKAMSLRKN
jgi:hypothetical protein